MQTDVVRAFSPRHSTRRDVAVCAFAWPVAVISALVAATDYRLLITVSLASSLAYLWAARRLWQQRVARLGLVLFGLPLCVLLVDTAKRLLVTLGQ